MSASLFSEMERYFDDGACITKFSPVIEKGKPQKCSGLVMQQVMPPAHRDELGQEHSRPLTVIVFPVGLIEKIQQGPINER